MSDQVEPEESLLRALQRLCERIGNRKRSTLSTSGTRKANEAQIRFMVIKNLRKGVME